MGAADLRQRFYALESLGCRLRDLPLTPGTQSSVLALLDECIVEIAILGTEAPILSMKIETLMSAMMEYRKTAGEPIWHDAVITAGNDGQ